MKNIQQPFHTRLAYILISVVIIIYGMYLLRDLLIPLTFSGIFALLLLPVTQKLESFRFPRWLAITLVILISLSFLAAFFYFIYEQISDLKEILPQLGAKAELWIKKLQTYIRRNYHISRSQQQAQSQQYINEFIKNNSSFIGDTLSVTTNLLGNLAIIPMYVFLLLLYRDFIRVFFYKAFKTVSSHRVDVVLKKIKEVVINYVVGLLMVIGVVGILNSLGLFILGIDHALFFGFFAAFMILLPYIGIAIGSILPIIFALVTKDSGWYAVAVGGLFGTVQFLEGNFITPYIVGGKVSVNSMAAIIALIIFGNLWGVGGLVLALPLTAIIKVIFDSVEALRPFGFLLGDIDHIDVKKRKA